MSVDVKEILENAKKEQQMEVTFEDDISLSLLSQDSQSDHCDTISNEDVRKCSISGNFRDTMMSAEEFMDSDEFKALSKDKVTVNGQWEKLCFCCTTVQHHAFHCVEDLRYCSGIISSMDLALLASHEFPMTGVYDRSLRRVIEGRINPNLSATGKGPSINTCLAWLCRAAQCFVTDLVPGGEIFPHAEQYLRERLEQPGLPVVSDEERTSLIVPQMCRVLDMLSVCDLRCQSPSDRSILLFAICRILLDRLSTCSIHQRASIAISNILNASSLSCRSVLVEFSRLFPLVSGNILALRLCIECFRLSTIKSSCILSLVGTLFINISERAECEPAHMEQVSEVNFINAYVGVVYDVLENVMDVYKDDKKGQSAIINLLDAALHPTMLKDVNIERKKQLNQMFNAIKRDLWRKPCPDDAIIDTLLGTLIRRLEMDESIF